MTLEEYIEEKRKRVANMTLAQARDLIAKTLAHSDMEIEFDKAVWMLLNCADEKINGGWVPVSERLPEDSGEYLVSVIDREDEGYKQVGVAWFAHPTDYNIKDGEWREIWYEDDVIAWMPKPKPYKAESEE